MKTVEVALLYENNTWDTRIVQIKHSEENSLETSVSEWFNEKISEIESTTSDAVVMACLYNDNPKTNESYRSR